MKIYMFGYIKLPGHTGILASGLVQSASTNFIWRLQRDGTDEVRPDRGAKREEIGIDDRRRLMSIDPHPSRACAVQLAVGDGTRLQSLTLKIAGDSRPKKFCRIFGDKSLLGHTRDRLSPLFREDRTMFVVTKGHEAFYSEDLFDADVPRIVMQPRNRGTDVAIAVALLLRLNRTQEGKSM
jgi:hypothetical protein